MVGEGSHRMHSVNTHSMFSKEPYTFWKEPYIFWKEPFKFWKEPCIFWICRKNTLSVNTHSTFSKEPNIFSKEHYISKGPYIFWKKPNKFWKEPCVFWIDRKNTLGFHESDESSEHHELNASTKISRTQCVNPMSHLDIDWVRDHFRYYWLNTSTNRHELNWTSDTQWVTNSVRQSNGSHRHRLSAWSFSILLTQYVNQSSRTH